jgi:hypothetical protein
VLGGVFAMGARGEEKKGSWRYFALEKSAIALGGLG